MRWWMRRNFDGMRRQSVIAVPFHPHFGFQTKKIEFSLFLLLDFGYLMLCGGERLFLYFAYWSTFWVLCNRLRWLLRLSISGLTRINTLVHYWLQKLAKLHFLAMSLQQDIARGVTAVTTTALSADWIAYIINLVDGEIYGPKERHSSGMISVPVESINVIHPKRQFGIVMPARAHAT